MTIFYKKNLVENTEFKVHERRYIDL